MPYPTVQSPPRARRALRARAPLLALLAALVAACSSTSGDEGGAAEAQALRVSYRSYSSGQLLELVSEAHTSRLEQYSEVRADAGRKVQTNDVMQGLVELLAANGFDEYAAEGPSPADGGGRFTWALEVETPEGPRHVLAQPGLPAQANKDLQRYMVAFVDTYNATYGLQAVDVTPGREPFKGPARR